MGPNSLTTNRNEKEDKDEEEEEGAAENQHKVGDKCDYANKLKLRCLIAVLLCSFITHLLFISPSITIYWPERRVSVLCVFFSLSFMRFRPKHFSFSFFFLLLFQFDCCCGYWCWLLLFFWWAPCSAVLSYRIIYIYVAPRWWHSVWLLFVFVIFVFLLFKMPCACCVCGDNYKNVPPKNVW